MINKKAAIIHWTIFGVLMSLGVFLLITKTGDFATTEIKGEQQTFFINNLYLEAENDLILTDGKISQFSNEIIRNLALGKDYPVSKCGTFPIEVTSGNLFDVLALNQGDVWCLPNLDTLFLQRLGKKLKEELPQHNYKNINIKDNLVSGKDDSKFYYESTGDYYMRYFYPTGFVIKTRYHLDGVKQIHHLAKELVKKCREEKELSGCISENFNGYIKSNGLIESVAKNDRHYFFLVPSLLNTSLDYWFILDFTPTKPFPIEGIETNKKEDLIKISFSYKRFAEEYRVYYTNWPSVKGKSGAVDEVFDNMPSEETFNFFKRSFELKQQNAELCPEEKQANVVYNCDSKLVYLFKPKSNGTEKIYLTVTSVKAGQESEIGSFVET